MAVPVAPTITKVLWTTQKLGELLGTSEKFTYLVEFTHPGGADGFEVFSYSSTGVSAGGGDVGVAVSGTMVFAETLDVEIGAGAKVDINAWTSADGDGPAATYYFTPTAIAGAQEISANVNGNVWHPLTIGPSKPTDWTWTLSGNPDGITISQKTGSDDGGVILGSPEVEGVFNLTVGLTNYGASSNILYAQNYPVTLHVSGERYIEDFHSNTSRTAVNIRYPKGTAASWNTNTAGELEVNLGDSFTLHAILRNGTGYLSSGVTALRFTAKLPGRPDGPAVLSAYAASPTVDTYGTVSAWPVTLDVDSETARALFAAANTPEGSSTDAASILLTAGISYTYGGRTYRSDAFPIRLKQPVSLF
jgi:hypothetical protein